MENGVKRRARFFICECEFGFPLRLRRNINPFENKRSTWAKQSRLDLPSAILMSRLLLDCPTKFNSKIIQEERIVQHNSTRLWNLLCWVSVFYASNTFLSFELNSYKRQRRWWSLRCGGWCLFSVWTQESLTDCEIVCVFLRNWLFKSANEKCSWINHFQLTICNS